MKIAVPTETDRTETRVAATPETVKKFIALGADGDGAGGRRRRARASPTPNMRRPARRSRPTPRRRWPDADIVLKVRRPTPDELKLMKRGALVVAAMDPYGHEDDVKAMADAGVAAFAMEFMPRITRAQVDGRPVEPGQPRRLPGRDRRRVELRPGAADDDDRGRHRAGGAGLRHGRGRRRPAGDRHRPPARRGGDRDRRAPGGEGAGRVARREIHRRRGRRVQAGRDRRRLRQGDVAGIPGEAGGARRRAHQEAGHRHHHGADPGPAGAAAGHRRHGRRR